MTFGLNAGAAWPAEPIRVALFMDLAEAALSGNAGLTLTADENLPIPDRRRAEFKILPGPQGLIINGIPTEIRRVTASSRDDTVRINGLPVRGILRVRLHGETLHVINELDVEDYLKGVVPAEIPPTWNAEAQKAQAIVARTYALYQRQAGLDKEYDLMATTADQVYGGLGKEHPAASRAVDQTRGLVLTYENELILAAYHSTSAGPTENVFNVWGLDFPYLKGVSCPFDQNSPHYQWNQSFRMDAVQESFSKAGYSLGTIASITPFRWTEAGRISRIRILHSEGELILKAEDLRRILGYAELRSTRFRIEKIAREIRIQGNGYGHAVGLCQWGAKEMAEMGYRYDQILSYYYPGVRIEPYASSTEDGRAP